MSVNVSIDSSTQIEPIDLNPSQSSSADAAVANYEALYESALQSIQQMLQQIFAEEGSTGAGNVDGGGDSLGSGMTTQGAAGALAAYMHQNGIGTLDPNQLYQIAYKPAAGTSPDVSEAAKFMLENPDAFNRIETHDVAGADGIAGVNDFDWAAQGGASDTSSNTSSADDAALASEPTAAGATPMDAQSASGALAAYMHEQGVQTLDPNRLYQMAYRPATGETAQDAVAAKYMLAHPDTFNQIETHDVAGADGIAGVNDFDWAAQGGLGNA